jgi:NAD(P)-dependent dehydrogenase (short-subunit alcohol dehydrogenase family)
VLRDLDGKVALLTGATSGLGRAAAELLAARGASTTIVGRDEAKTERVAREIRAGTGNPNVDTLVADLSTLDGMRHVSDTFPARNTRLDILVNNAGALFNQSSMTADGIEVTFALNHLAYFAISTALTGMLASTPGARVVSTASVVHKFGRLHLPAVATRDRGATQWGAMRAYCDSKLANVVFSAELARRLADAGVTANSLHPGFTRSMLFAATRGSIGTVVRSGPSVRMAQPPHQAADTLVWLATDPAAGARSGGYFVDRAEVPVSRRARDAGLSAELWALSRHLVERARTR